MEAFLDKHRLGQLRGQLGERPLSSWLAMSMTDVNAALRELEVDAGLRRAFTTALLEHLTQMTLDKDAPAVATEEVERICGLARTFFLQLFHVSADSNLASPSCVDSIKRGYKAVRKRIHPENLNAEDDGVPGADRAMAIVEMAYRELLSTAADSLSKISEQPMAAAAARTSGEHRAGVNEALARAVAKAAMDAQVLSPPLQNGDAAATTPPATPHPRPMVPLVTAAAAAVEPAVNDDDNDCDFFIGLEAIRTGYRDGENFKQGRQRNAISMKMKRSIARFVEGGQRGLITQLADALEPTDSAKRQKLKMNIPHWKTQYAQGLLNPELEPGSPDSASKSKGSRSGSKSGSGCWRRNRSANVMKAGNTDAAARSFPGRSAAVLPTDSLDTSAAAGVGGVNAIRQQDSTTLADGDHQALVRAHKPS